MTIPIFDLHRIMTHRLIPSEHSYSVLEDLWDTEEEREAVFEADGLTSQRLQHEADRLPGIDRSELVAGIRYQSIINAAFCYPSNRGGRFNDNGRGAWYASFELIGAVEEVIWHHWEWLQEAGQSKDECTKDEWTAYFEGDYRDMRELPGHAALNPDPKIGYPHGQALAAQWLQEQGQGVIYPSARARGHTNIACFRPALVSSAQRGETLSVIFDGHSRPTILKADGEQIFCRQ